MQPDIEIYLKDCTPHEFHEWLSHLFACCSAWVVCGQLHRCRCDGISVTWYSKAVGSWHCVVFDSSNTPWLTDLDCAQTIHKALGIEVRCSPGSWAEAQGEEAADEWLKVDELGVSSIVWRT